MPLCLCVLCLAHLCRIWYRSRWYGWVLGSPFDCHGRWSIPFGVLSSGNLYEITKRGQKWSDEDDLNFSPLWSIFPFVCHVLRCWVSYPVLSLKSVSHFYCRIALLPLIGSFHGQWNLIAFISIQILKLSSEVFNYFIEFSFELDS
jgi:hypothetical protein